MKKKLKQKIGVFICMLFAAGILIFGYRWMDRRLNSTKYETGQTKYSFAMGTSVSVSLYGADIQEYEKLEKEIERLDSKVISWRDADSELYKLNHGYKAGEPYKVGDELYIALKQAYSICEDSEGALDITLRPLAQLWNIEDTEDAELQIPGEKDIEQALSKTGFEHVVLDDDNYTVTVERSDMVIDLGAVGKGFALDVLEQTLKKDDVPGAAISVGGSVLVYGEKEDGDDFRVGIRNPKGAQDEMIGYLEFPSGSNICISTSGDYEKYKEKDGRRYHHIFDRKTGYPAESGLSAVTVVCKSGLYSDALSTACFVLGYDKALPLLEKYDAEAIFIDQENNITITEGLKDIYHISVN